MIAWQSVTWMSWDVICTIRRT